MDIRAAQPYTLEEDVVDEVDDRGVVGQLVQQELFARLGALGLHLRKLAAQVLRQLLRIDDRELQRRLEEVLQLRFYEGVRFVDEAHENAALVLGELQRPAALDELQRELLGAFGQGRILLEALHPLPLWSFR